ncbi:hypothetical protein PWT90_09562 [Aphanocladium album]|nr:hypothetical protein PWT90_09562 [Aphanocladium album]
MSIHISLDSFPPEIMLVIAGFCDDTGHRHLFSTCRKLRGLLARGAGRLYRHIRVMPNHDSSLHHHLAALLRTAWLHPHIVTLKIYISQQQQQQQHTADAFNVLSSLLRLLRVRGLSIYPTRPPRGDVFLSSSSSQSPFPQRLQQVRKETIPIMFLELHEATASAHIVNIVTPGSTRVPALDAGSDAASPSVLLQCSWWDAGGHELPAG